MNHTSLLIAGLAQAVSGSHPAEFVASSFVNRLQGPAGMGFVPSPTGMAPAHSSLVAIAPCRTLT